MGVALSVLGKLGLPSVDSLTTDKVYENFFIDVKDYPGFHNSFIKMFSDINTIMPGKHYILKATTKEMEELYKDWKEKAPTDEEKKKLVVDFLNLHVEEYKANSTAMIATGLVAPGAAVVLKKSGQKVPQLKMLRLDLVPNAVFVPTVTLLSLIGVRMFNLSKAPAKFTNKA
ncbi:uncharacterized protein LOC121976362 isoform X1 [Zingiber officinale]|uniref:uncharacterized protein LOC121976362 isoform X1 n=1 Tax=Zingiber officinale TaxID=94328 RepID=UPI001C4B4FDB|nr:uncharacterized protein LOC121976362 isoform X1 [Zingiber officinale]XP_042384428.1 uncharacterized protein LOC121976362 isoform X1 [Zingiber officinale]XP_042384430.1 uncharacterized protein LOC121976362 isoform X1 [Zingiber officinale]XP_042384431.1 uncharacterized protein LOC121976362 isoform X1 [Zingiber officinale]